MGNLQDYRERKHRNLGATEKQAVRIEIERSRSAKRGQRLRLGSPRSLNPTASSAGLSKMPRGVW